MPLPVTSAITTPSGRPRRRSTEQLEEVAADLARRLVVARQVIARDVGRLERDEAPLLEAAQRQLGADAAPGVWAGGYRPDVDAPCLDQPLDRDRDGLQRGTDRALADRRAFGDEPAEVPPVDLDIPCQSRMVEAGGGSGIGVLEPDRQLTGDARERSEDRLDRVGHDDGAP